MGIRTIDNTTFGRMKATIQILRGEIEFLREELADHLHTEEISQASELDLRDEKKCLIEEVGELRVKLAEAEQRIAELESGDDGITSACDEMLAALEAKVAALEAAGWQKPGTTAPVTGNYLELGEFSNGIRGYMMVHRRQAGYVFFTRHIFIPESVEVQG